MFLAASSTSAVSASSGCKYLTALVSTAGILFASASSTMRLTCELENTLPGAVRWLTISIAKLPGYAKSPCQYSSSSCAVSLLPAATSRPTSLSGPSSSVQFPLAKSSASLRRPIPISFLLERVDVLCSCATETILQSVAQPAPALFPCAKITQRPRFVPSSSNTLRSTPIIGDSPSFRQAPICLTAP